MTEVGKERDEKSRIQSRIRIRGTDPRIRARPKVSGIHNTGPSYRGGTVY
jgi:hypothetical protein